MGVHGIMLSGRVSETLLFTLYVQYIVGYGNVHTVFTMKAPAMWASGFPFIVCE